MLQDQPDGLAEGLGSRTSALMSLSPAGQALSQPNHPSAPLLQDQPHSPLTHRWRELVWYLRLKLVLDNRSPPALASPHLAQPGTRGPWGSFASCAERLDRRVPGGRPAELELE